MSAPTRTLDPHTVAGEQAAARRLQWEAAVRHSQMQRDARRHEIRRTVMVLLISAALICALPMIVKICFGSMP